MFVDSSVGALVLFPVLVLVLVLVLCYGFPFGSLFFDRWFSCSEVMLPKIMKENYFNEMKYICSFESRFF